MSSILSLKHVSYDFGSNWALKNISFSLDKGDFLYLTGPSGAGKTSLIRLLHGDLPLQRGKAHISGFNLNTMKQRQIPYLRRQVSVVFQDFKILLRKSVYANVAIALEAQGMPKPRIDKRVRAVLRSLQLDHKINTPCEELSGGEQQRVAVARAVVINPKIIMADEPTGNLDPDLSLRMLAIFKQFNNHGTTVIIATHSTELLEAHPDAKVLSLKEGQVHNANWAIEGLTQGDPA